MCSIEKGKTLYTSGQDPSHVYVVIEGCILAVRQVEQATSKREPEDEDS